jgi:hypothetical protein
MDLIERFYMDHCIGGTSHAESDWKGKSKEMVHPSYTTTGAMGI